MELCCQRPLGARYVICDEQHYKACLRKAADLGKAKADTQEFLGIAGLNRRGWEKDGNLVRSIQKRGWLWLRGVRDRNPDTDGWWVINALLSEVHRGSLLAIKGPRADLFPRPHSTPLRTLPASAVYLPNREPTLFGRYDPGTRQGRLIGARAAMAGGSGGGGLPDAAVVGALTGDGDTSTPLSDAQPFEYVEKVADAVQQVAVGSAQAAECMMQWEQDEADCRLFGKMMGGYAGVQMCLDRARYRYNVCMGYTRPI
ncbi:hypothetical protein SAMN06265784_105434 [Paraburkholderia susongensis]|uniref:Uncharacterized protein n=1 Tax=Paraburkholderia susongensis TaxID=1515439 RepID=A0A1X7LC53_9BURK|nr:hypothetical protein SAMN06265784_105434 [Paraburkholderia susongensis]